LILALLFAIILDGLLRRLTFLRVLFLIPAMLSALAIGYIWSYIYTPEEVRNITQAPARERDSGGWRKVISWISNG